MRSAISLTLVALGGEVQSRNEIGVVIGAFAVGILTGAVGLLVAVLLTAP